MNYQVIASISCTRIIRPVATLLLFGSFFFGSSAQSRTSTRHWRPLFNGHDLTDWHLQNGKDAFKVDRGVIVGQADPNGSESVLITDQAYGDFTLKLDFLTDSLINSGIEIRNNFKSDGIPGYEVAIDPSLKAAAGGLRQPTGNRWLYPLTLNPAARKAYKPGQWNHLYVECIANTIRTWINDVPASNLEDSSSQSGFIGIVVHQNSNGEQPSGSVRFRHIEISTAPLSPRPFDQVFVVNNIPNTLSAQEKNNGIQLLWDGKTTTGWRGIFRTAFPAEGWAIDNGVLTIHNSNGHEEGSGGDIVTDREFRAFDLQFEFKYTEGANSGVKYDVKETYNPDGKSGIGLEYQILDDEHHPDAKLGRNGDRTLSSLYDLIPRKDIPEAFKPIGQWNTGRIIVYPDNHVEHWLNGYKMLQYEKGSREFLDQVAISKYKVWKNFGRWKEGHILLQDHGNEVSFRSIKIKVL